MKKEARRAAERWFDAGILDAETLQKIEQFESERNESGPDYLRTVLTVAGGGMVALGLVLLVANNWSVLSTVAQVTLAVSLLVSAQVFAGYVLVRKTTSRALRELSASALFIAIGASMVIISGIYQMSGSVTGLIQVWAILGLPVVYLMRSYVASVLYLIMFPVLSYNLAISGITQGESTWPMLVLLLLWLPYYWLMSQSKPWLGVTRLHHILLPLVLLTIIPGFYTHGAGLLAGYAALGLLLTLTGLSGFSDPRSGLKNAYITTGLLTTAFVLWLLSMGYVWRDMNEQRLMHLPDLLRTGFLAAGVIWLGLRGGKGDDRMQRIWLLLIPILAAFGLYLLLFDTFIPVIVSNLTLLALALMLVFEGNRRISLGYLNLGLFFLSVQILSRFFIDDWPLWVRGAGFVVVGLMFMLANRKLLNTRKAVANPKIRFGGDIS
ncbi:MAG: DUF2157 domain-containing protein [Balneolia bacterium]|nr:DUF2157 domain-containing protein [Balneolia bacterium]